MKESFHRKKKIKLVQIQKMRKVLADFCFKNHLLSLN